MLQYKPVILQQQSIMNLDIHSVVFSGIAAEILTKQAQFSVKSFIFLFADSSSVKRKKSQVKS